VRSRSSTTSLWLLALLLIPVAASAAAPAPPFQPLLLEISLNGQATGDPRLVLRDSSGALWVEAGALSSWRLAAPSCKTATYEGKVFCRLDSIPFLAAKLSDADQSLALTADPRLFDRQDLSMKGDGPAPMAPRRTGAYLNYDLLAEGSRGGVNVSGAFDAVVFTRFGVGESDFIARTGTGRKLVRLETSWTIDRPDSMTSLRLGDSISAGGPQTAPVRFAGLQFGRNFAVQPGFLTLPLPGIAGSAALPSIVDVYVDNRLQSSRPVQPGPFQLNDIPVSSGGGNIQIVTRDLLGRETVATESYYAAPTLLRRGLSDFSYEIGFERRDFGLKSNRYGSFIASATHRYGVSDALTVEGHGEVTPSVQVASLAVDLASLPFGLVRASAAVSHAKAGAGVAAGLSFEHRTQKLSFGAEADYTGTHYRYAGIPADFRLPRLSVQAFADLPVRGGSIGLNYLHRDFVGQPSEDLAGAFANFNFGRLGAFQVFARRSVLGRAQVTVGGNFAMTLGHRRSASASAETGANGRFATFAYQQDAPLVGGSAVRATATVGSLSSFDAEYRLQTRYAAFGAEVADANGSAGIRLTARGSIGSLGSDLFAARSLGPSFGEVEVPGYKGVRVYADNQLIGVTGKDGKLLIPALRAYEGNVISIDDADLPIDVLPGETRSIVRPFARTGAIVAFAPRRERGVVLKVRMEDGSELPAGALARIDGGQADLVAVSGGVIYAPNLEGARRFVVGTGAGACAFTATVPANDDPQPVIDHLICRKVPSYVAR
jgi:outer membrane usher protein